jgi:signal transduction histidine kinase
MVFRNLADNALKYSEAAVEVRARDTALELRSRQGQGSIATVTLPYEQAAGR